MKDLIKKFFKKFGYTIGASNNFSTYSDPIVDQKMLIGEENKVVIFDVGAHNGQTSLLYNHFFKYATIYSFEPSPKAFSIMKERVNTYSNINIYNKALGNIDGKVNFYLNKYDYTNSMLSTHHDAIKSWGADHLETKEVIQVASSTLDSFIRESNIEHLDILKIDTQGSEHCVIEGASHAIEKGMIKLVYLEIICMPAYESQKYFDEMLHLMRSKGFQLYNLYNFSMTDFGQLRQMDAIFLSDKFYSQILQDRSALKGMAR